MTYYVNIHGDLEIKDIDAFTSFAKNTTVLDYFDVTQIYRPEDYPDDYKYNKPRVLLQGYGQYDSDELEETLSAISPFIKNNQMFYATDENNKKWFYHLHDNEWEKLKPIYMEPGEIDLDTFKILQSFIEQIKTKHTKEN